MQLTIEEVNDVCDLIHDLCGVHLDEQKTYLIESRLKEFVDGDRFATYRSLVDHVRHSDDATLRQQVVDAITTQETHFFRDSSPFEALKHKALPDVIDQKESTPGQKSIRVWSAACSTGQEPYSIAMTIFELLSGAGDWNIHLLATDISNSAIAKASRGVYAEHEIERGLPADLKNRYFQRDGSRWAVDDRIRSMVAFKQRNLHDSFAGLGKFDIIFCRNVAIYFTPDARRSLFERIASSLTPAGFLFVGSSELLTDLGGPFQPQSHCRSVFYQPNRAECLP